MRIPVPIVVAQCGVGGREAGKVMEGGEVMEVEDPTDFDFGFTTEYDVVGLVISTENIRIFH